MVRGTQGHSSWYHWKALGTVSYSPSIVTMALSSIISEIKRDTGEKSRFFHTPLFDAPVRWGVPVGVYHPVWYGKTRMVGLPDGKKTLRIYVTV